MDVYGSDDEREIDTNIEHEDNLCVEFDNNLPIYVSDTSNDQIVQLLLNGYDVIIVKTKHGDIILKGPAKYNCSRLLSITQEELDPPLELISYF